MCCSDCGILLGWWSQRRWSLGGVIRQVAYLGLRAGGQYWIYLGLGVRLRIWWKAVIRTGSCRWLVQTIVLGTGRSERRERRWRHLWRSCWSWLSSRAAIKVLLSWIRGWELCCELMCPGSWSRTCPHWFPLNVWRAPLAGLNRGSVFLFTHFHFFLGLAVRICVLVLVS
jgi:hypothetical protein